MLLWLLLTATAFGQSRIDTGTRAALKWPNTHAADVLSTWLVIGALAEPCVLEDRSWDCAKHEGIRVGIAAGLAEITKLIIHRERPDGSENVSFYSMHTSLTCAAIVRYKAWEACPAVAYLRIAADKHWLTDVATGAGVGIVVAKVF